MDITGQVILEKIIRSGGNGEVAPGQKSCYTPMVYDPVGYYARAEGYRFNLSTGKLDDYLTGFY